LDGDQIAQGTLLGHDSLSAWPGRLPEIDMVHAAKPGESRQGDSAICRALSASGRDGGRMKTHQFTLVLTGVAELTPAIADALYEATLADIECNMRNGIAFLECTRKAAALRKAILATIAEVESAGIGVRVVRVESETANTIAKINADLLEASHSA
jgi:hypothetical protein